MSVFNAARNTELSTSGKYELDRLMRSVEQQCSPVNDADEDSAEHSFNQLQVGLNGFLLLLPNTLVVHV